MLQWIKELSSLAVFTFIRSLQLTHTPGIHLIMVIGFANCRARNTTVGFSAGVL